MSVNKIIEIMGDSSEGWEAAAAEAVAEASKTVKNGKVDRYRVTCKITFEVE